MHENAMAQLGLAPKAANGYESHPGQQAPNEADTARATGESSISAEVLNHALSEASGWVASRRVRAQQKAPVTRASTQAWILRGAFGLFAAVVLGSFVFIAVGLMSVAEASALLMPVAILAAMSIGLFLGGSGD